MIKIFHTKINTKHTSFPHKSQVYVPARRDRTVSATRGLNPPCHMDRANTVPAAKNSLKFGAGRLAVFRVSWRAEKKRKFGKWRTPHLFLRCHKQQTTNQSKSINPTKREPLSIFCPSGRPACSAYLERTNERTKKNR